MQKKNFLAGLEAPIFQDNSAKFEKEQAFGKSLLKTAWAVEILAASLGLLIAFFVAYDAYLKNPQKDTSAVLNAALGALPFILIAIIEPTKIPLAGGLYKVKKIIWKIVIGTALLALTLVTFETMFTGLERQLTNVTAEITRGLAKVTNIENEIDIINEDIARRESLDQIQITNEFGKIISDEVASYQAERSNNTQDYNQKKFALQTSLDTIVENLNQSTNAWLAPIISTEKILQQKVESLRGELEEKKQGLISPQIEAKENKNLQNLEQQRKIIELEINETGNWINSRESLQIRKAQARIGVNEDGKSGENTRRNFENWRQQKLEIDEQISKEIAEIYARYEKIRQSQEDQIAQASITLNREIENLTEIQKKLVAAQSEMSTENAPSQIKQLQEQKFEKQSQINSFEADFEAMQRNTTIKHAENIAKIEAERDFELSKIQELKGGIPELQEAVRQLENDARIIQQETREQAHANQIYRIAAKYRGYDDVLAVTEDDRTRVAVVWYGSIALICAVIGTVLAIVGNIMTDPDAFVEKQKVMKRRPVRRALRNLFVSIRKNLHRKPSVIYEEKIVEIEKVVEVEKEVTKVVEVEKYIDREVEKVVVKEVEKYIPDLILVPIFAQAKEGEAVDLKAAQAYYDTINEKISGIVADYQKK